jgi:hypothetical protein
MPQEAHNAKESTANGSTAYRNNATGSTQCQRKHRKWQHSQ